jgi:hypothetical protein
MDAISTKEMVSDKSTTISHHLCSFRAWLLIWTQKRASAFYKSIIGQPPPHTNCLHNLFKNVNMIVFLIIEYT